MRSFPSSGTSHAPGATKTGTFLRWLSGIASAGLLCLASASCGGYEGPDRSLSRPYVLEYVRTIVRQDASEATAWLGRLRDLRHDPVSDHLLGVDIDDRVIVEFTTGGELVGFFGRYGQGPEELRNVSAFEVTDRHVVALDSGNGKLVVFDRSTREMLTEVRLNRGTLDLTMLDDTLVAVMPGPEGTLYEQIGIDGRRAGAFGDGGFVGRQARSRTSARGCSPS